MKRHPLFRVEGGVYRSAASCALITHFCLSPAKAFRSTNRWPFRPILSRRPSYARSHDRLGAHQTDRGAERYPLVDSVSKNHTVPASRGIPVSQKGPSPAAGQTRPQATAMRCAPWRRRGKAASQLSMVTRGRGPCMVSVATTRPLASRIGTAMATMPSKFSWLLVP